MPSQRKAPYRPRQRTEISQAFNDGVVKILAVSDGASGGFLPSPTLSERLKLCYQERKLGIRRYYDAMQNQIHVERVIRVPKQRENITNQDIAETEDGKQYRIDLVQLVPDSYPPCVDLTLTEYSQGVSEIRLIGAKPVPPIEQEGGDGDA